MSPTLALDGDGWSGAEVLVELVSVLVGVVYRRSSVWKTALTPSLSGILVFC